MKELSIYYRLKLGIAFQADAGAGQVVLLNGIYVCTLLGSKCCKGGSEMPVLSSRGKIGSSVRQHFSLLGKLQF